jgi:hypothetical protein
VKRTARGGALPQSSRVLARPPPNTYEAPSRQQLKRSPPAAAQGRGVRFCSRPRTPSSLRSSAQRPLDPAPNTYRGSRPPTPQCERGGPSPPRPRSSSVPSCRPPHDVRSRRSVVSRLRGGAESRSRELCVRSRERAYNQALRAAGSRAHDRCLLAVDAAWGRCGLVRARSMDGSRWATGSLARTPQLIVAAKRFASNAVPRASM